MQQAETVVIGAGLAGMSFAYHYDPATPIYEALPDVGGLVRTIEFNGCKFDLAPHLLHIKNPYVRQLVFEKFKLAVETHQRKASIYYDDVIIPYPFELNLLKLKDKTKQDCIEGLSEVTHFNKEEEQAIRSGSYRDYVLKAFGTGIANHYLLPYNRKIWDTDPAAMTCEFMNHLITADKDQIIHNAYHPNEDKFGYNTEFYYPVRKGIQDLADVFAKQLSNIHLNQTVTFFNTRKKTLTLASGQNITYSKLINTAPLRFVIENSDRDDLKEMASKLVSTSVYTVNIVIKGTVPDTHWMYFPDPALSFYRISFPKNYFTKSTPNNEQIIAVEVGSRDHSKSMDEIKNNIVEEIKKMDIFSIDEILFVHCIKIQVAYCIYDKERPALVKTLMTELQQDGIFQIGRYGRWEYNAMQDAILDGKTMAEQLKTIHA